MAKAKLSLYSLAPLPSTLSSSLSPPPNREHTSLLSIVKLAAEILSVLVLIITLILAFRKLTTNNTGNATQTLPEGPVDSTDGVINSGNHDNIQLALNFNAV